MKSWKSEDRSQKLKTEETRNKQPATKIT